MCGLAPDASWGVYQGTKHCSRPGVDDRNVSFNARPRIGNCTAGDRMSGKVFQDSSSATKERTGQMKILLIAIAGIGLLGLSSVVIGSLLPKGHVASRSASFRATSERLFSMIAGPHDWRPDLL